MGDYLYYVLKVLCQAKWLLISENSNKIVEIKHNCIGQEFAKICFQGGVNSYNWCQLIKLNCANIGLTYVCFKNYKRMIFC